MNRATAPVIGIVGGMGPQAGVDLANRITQLTRARYDQDHLSTILMSFPGMITDRTAFLEDETAINPGHAIAGIIKKLEAAGAELVVMACNTSYAPPIFSVVTRELQRANSSVTMIHMPEETCRMVSRKLNVAHRVGLMATNGTYKSGIYNDQLLRFGLTPVMPEQEFQNDIIHRMIYDPLFGIKANPRQVTSEVKQLLKQSLSFFDRRGVDAIIFGCTELSVLADEPILRGRMIINSNDATASALIDASETRMKSIPENNLATTDNGLQ